MSFELKESTTILEIPKAKDFVVDGKTIGKVEPKFYTSDELSWHSCINLSQSLMDRIQLVQGSGPTPHKSIVNAIICARRERDYFIERLAWLENQLRTTGMTDAELKEKSL